VAKEMYARSPTIAKPQEKSNIKSQKRKLGGLANESEIDIEQ
jgi:hypothetical protein